MKAMIFAAGKGTRLRPFTDHHPKAMMEVNGIPLLESNIRYLQSFGINEFVINLHHVAEQIEDFLKEKNHFGAQIEFSHEKDQLLETGGGLIFAKKLLDQEEDFLIMNADILTDMTITDFVNFHRKQNSLATLAVSDRKSSRKLLFDNEMILKGWMNTDTGEQRLAGFDNNYKNLAFSGIHCVDSQFFNDITRTGKFSIMEEYLDLMKTVEIYGYEHNARLVDVGRPKSVLEAEQHFK